MVSWSGHHLYILKITVLAGLHLAQILCKSYIQAYLDKRAWEKMQNSSPVESIIPVCIQWIRGFVSFRAFDL
jgi:hypothetical protein